MKSSGLIDKRKSDNLPLFTIISINFCLFLSSESILNFPCLIFCIPLYHYLIKNNSYNFSKIKINRLNSILLIFFFMLVFITLMINVNNIYLKNPEYYLWPFFSLLNLIPILVICFIIKDNRKISYRSSFMLFLFFISFALLSLTSDGRFRFGFGPNMLYRILIFNFIFFSFLNSSKLLFSLALPFFLITLNSIGSRGALITIFFLIIFLILYSIKSKLKLLFKYMILIFIFLYYVTLDFFLDLSNSFRIFKINFTDNNRSSYYLDFLNWYNQASFNEILFGSGFRSWPFNDLYPHNFILEFFHGYGVIITLMILSLIIIFFLFQNRKIVFLFIPFLVGSSISGSLYDNFILLSFIFLMIFRSESINSNQEKPSQL